MGKGRLGKKPKNKGKLGKLAKKKIEKKSRAEKSSQVNAARSPAPAPAPAPAPSPAPTPASVSAPIADGERATNQASKKEKKEGVNGKKTSGFIFMCNGKTKPECYRHRVFGLPLGKIEVVEKIKGGAKLFLFDTDMRLLYGIYKAVGNGGKNLEPSAFGGRFAAQVRFKIFKDCLPLPENVFKNAIEENYDTKFKFKSELNSKQVRKLFTLFRPLPAAPSPDDRRPMPAIQSPREDRYLEARRVPRSPLPLRTHVPLVTHPVSDPYGYPARAPASRHLPPAGPPPLSDPYGYPPHAQPVVESRHLPPVGPPPPSDPYGYPARGQHVVEPHHLPPVGPPPPSDPYGYPARAPHMESRHLPPIGPPPTSDPYGYPARAPHVVESRHLPPVGPPPRSDPYGYPARAPPVVESRHLPAVGPPPPNDPYYLPDPQRSLQPANPVVPEHELYHRYRTVPEIIPRERVEAADPRDYRVFARRETEVVPRSDRLDEYYALRAARGAMDPPPQAGYLRPGYEDPHRRYADYHSRPVSGNGNASNVSVSSLYSFAGAPSSYRGL